MKFTREPIYKFDSMNSVGVNDVPVGSMVCIVDANPAQDTALFVIKISSTVIPSDTLGDWFSNSQLWTFPY